MSTTSSRLDELRKYRFKNGTAAPKIDNGESVTTNGSVDNTASKMKMATGRKRIRVISVSDSSGEDDGIARHPSKIPNTAQKDSPAKLTIGQREQRLVEIQDQFPSVDTMILQDELARTEWDVAKAVEIMKQKKVNQSNGVHNGHHSSHDVSHHVSHVSHASAQHKVNPLAIHFVC